MDEARQQIEEKESERLKKWKEGFEKKMMMMASREKAESLAQAMNENDDYEKRDQDVLKLYMNKRYPNGCDRYRLRVSHDDLLIIKKVFGVAT